MWVIGVEVEQQTSAPPPKKFLDPPLSSVKPQKNNFLFEFEFDAMIA